MIKYSDTRHNFTLSHNVGLRAFGAQPVLVACLFFSYASNSTLYSCERVNQSLGRVSDYRSLELASLFLQKLLLDVCLCIISVGWGGHGYAYESSNHAYL